MQTILVTDDPVYWSFLKECTVVIDAASYVSNPVFNESQDVRVINLCCSYQYQSVGYYISLLAEARAQQAIPSASQIQDALNINLLKYITQDLVEPIQKALNNQVASTLSLNVYFGQSKDEAYSALVKILHALFPLPMFCIEFVKQEKWLIQSIKPLAKEDIPKTHQLDVQSFAYHYFRAQMPLALPLKRKAPYALAILVEPGEGETAPSNQKALEYFVATGEEFGFDVDIVTKEHAKNIMQYDALFIRATTSVNHYTYQLARCAALNNLVVIDDPQSIIRCTNKVFLAELFEKNNILTPKTQLINKYDTVLPPIDFPCVLKKPDSSCSLGVVKIENLESLQERLSQFFKTSDILLIQPFIYTDFDWRIGIIDNKPLYACRYYMAKNHWQIVNWSNDDALIHDSVLLDEVPEDVMNLALKTTQLIGDGLYGVDIKSAHGKHYVIEVNDNPSINAGIEDALLKKGLYEKIMNVFLQRIHKKQITTPLVHQKALFGTS